MAITNVDPQTLVQAHKGGDSDAFPVIVRTYYEGLLAHAVRQLGDPHAAEDAVQETLVRAYRALPRFNGQYHLRAWLHRILTNVCHDEGNRRRREGSLVDLVRTTTEPVESTDLQDDIADRLDASHHEVVAALASLPESYRQALVLRYVDDLSFRELAERTGLSEGNARARVHRGRAALRRALGSAVGVFVFLIPGLRRGQRPAMADVAAGSLVQTSTHAAPLMTRLAESGAGQLMAERAGAFSNVLAMVATVAVPVAAPVVGNTIVDRFDERPPAIVAAAPVEEVIADDDGSAEVTGPQEAVAATTDTTIVDPATATTVAGIAATTDESTSTSVPATTTTTVGAPAAPAEDTSEPAEETPAAPPPVDPAAPTPIEAELFSDQLTAINTSSAHTELHGTNVTITVNGESLTGTLTGSIRRATGGRGEAPAEEAPPAEEGSTEEPATDPGTEPTTGDGGGGGGDPAPADSDRHAFSSVLALTIDDGRAFDIRLSGWLTDAPDGTWQIEDATFELFDPCQSPVGSGSTTGSFYVEEAPVPSRLQLHLTGVEQAPPTDCNP